MMMMMMIVIKYIITLLTFDLLCARHCIDHFTSSGISNVKQNKTSNCVPIKLCLPSWGPGRFKKMLALAQNSAVSIVIISNHWPSGSSSRLQF